MTSSVIVAGGGPAALEAVLALRDLAGERVDITLLAPGTTYITRAWTVVEPFAEPGAAVHPLSALTDVAQARRIADTLAAVDVETHTAITGAGRPVPYDHLVVAVGAVVGEALPNALVFKGDPDSVAAAHGLVQDIEGGYTKRIAFVVPEGPVWLLPLYELALKMAERARDTHADVELMIVSAESAPLQAFGGDTARAMRLMLHNAGVEFIGGQVVESPRHGELLLPRCDRALAVDRVVTLPRLRGRSIGGLRGDEYGFLPVDAYGRVTEGVWACGDAAAREPKLGSLATRQADVIAGSIAAAVGAPVQAERYDRALESLLVSGEGTLRVTREGLAPVDPTDRFVPKVHGRYLSTWLAGRERAGTPTMP